MAVTVEKYQIGGNVVVVVAVPVVNFELVFCHETKSAEHTAARLSFQQGNHPVGFGRVSSQAVDPVGPVSVEGAFLPLYLDMSFDRHVCVLHEGGFSIRKVQSVAFPQPVAMFSPGTTFAGVLPFGPFG